MCGVIDVEYSDGVVEWVWENMVLAGVFDGVLSHLGVLIYGGGEVTSVLGDICACGGVCCENRLLEIMEPVRFHVIYPYAL